MEFSTKPLVSIVTPFYNTAEYLEECIKSVLSQTYDSWEYVLVNNCSTDGSLKIAEKLAKQDPRIKLINNNFFLSQLQNYNHALRQISKQSKYCKIVSADDWIFPECLMKMLEIAEEYPSIGIVGSYRLEETKVTCDGLAYSNSFISGREICRLMLIKGLFLFGSPTSLLFRSEIVRNRDSFYNEDSMYADTEACYEILQNNDFGFVYQLLTFTRRENESVSSVRQHFGADYLDKFIIVKKYGHLYLNNHEYQKCFKITTKNYYGYLGKSVFLNKGKDFWQYHKKGLQTIGFKPSLYKLLTSAFLVILDFILNPKRTIERLFRKLLSKGIS